MTNGEGVDFHKNSLDFPKRSSNDGSSNNSTYIAMGRHVFDYYWRFDLAYPYSSEVSSLQRHPIYFSCVCPLGCELRENRNSAKPTFGRNYGRNIFRISLLPFRSIGRNFGRNFGSGAEKYLLSLCDSGFATSPRNRHQVCRLTTTISS